MASLFPPPPGARGILVFSLVFSSSSFLTHCVAGLGSGPQGSSAPGTRQDLGSLGAVTSGMALAPGIRRPGLLPGCTGRAQPRPTWSRCQQSRHWESLVLRLEGLVQPCTEQAHRLQPESGLQARGEKGGSVPLCQYFMSIWLCVNSQPGEGNGTPLQYSCLENPMDGGAW